MRKGQISGTSFIILVLLIAAFILGVIAIYLTTSAGKEFLAGARGVINNLIGIG